MHRVSRHVALNCGALGRLFSHRGVGKVEVTVELRNVEGTQAALGWAGSHTMSSIVLRGKPAAGTRLQRCAAFGKGDLPGDQFLAPRRGGFDRTCCL